MAEEKYSEAIIEFKNVLQLDPNYVDAKYQLGLAYLKLGGPANLSNAFKLLSEAVEKKPDLVDAQIKLAGLYLASNDLSKRKGKIRPGPPERSEKQCRCPFGEGPN
ncbi:MAG: tetratricopeptide repeat protein [Candidatus Manganitrophus sp.]|nr:tetratricopeptide repeat protein [Candidatus Manganitrophus sp.]